MKNFNALIYVRNVKAMKGLSLMFIMSANTSLTYSLYKCLASPINSDLFFFLSKKNKIAYPVHMTQFIKLDQVKFVPVVIACHILITCHCSITSWLMWRKIRVYPIHPYFLVLVPSPYYGMQNSRNEKKENKI